MTRSQPQARSDRPSYGAIADAVGHCLLVFTFVPPLLALPGWLYREAGNHLNLEEPLVLAFVPVRGVTVLLNAFYAGVVPGLVAGLVTGVALTVLARRAVAPRLLGAVIGALAAGVALVATLVVARGSAWAPPANVVAFELGAGLLCGGIAAPTALRFMRTDRR